MDLRDFCLELSDKGYDVEINDFGSTDEPYCVIDIYDSNFAIKPSDVDDLVETIRDYVESHGFKFNVSKYETRQGFGDVLNIDDDSKLYSSVVMTINDKDLNERVNLDVYKMSSEIVQNCKDILLDLEDKGYMVIVQDKITNYKYKDLAEMSEKVIDKCIIDIHIKNVKMADRPEVVQAKDRLTEYLESEGFVRIGWLESLNGSTELIFQKIVTRE
jgi:hypothetical protein